MAAPHRIFRVLGHVASAVVIGVATIVIPKVDPTEHWSTPPTAEARNLAPEEQAAPAPGDP